MSDRIKVLFLTSWYPNKENPMEGVFIREHARAISKYDDLIVVHLSGPTNKNLLWEFYKELDFLISAGITTYHYSSKKILFPGITYFVFLIGILKFFMQLKNHGFYPDIIQTNIYSSGIPALILKKIFHIPFTITEHSTSFPREALSAFQIHKARIAFENADSVIAVSSSLKCAIQNLGIHANFRIIPNAVDHDVFFAPNTDKNQYFLFRFLFVSRLVPSKGLDDLLKSLSILIKKKNNWHLDIIGDGPNKSEYELLMNSLGLDRNVTFHGYLPKEKIADFMRNSDLFILPSHIETFSVVTAEALACGLPVLATRCGGPEEYITAEVGRLIPIGNIDILTHELDWMMDNIKNFNPGIISKFAIDRFGLKAVGLQYHTIYESILNRRI